MFDSWDDKYEYIIDLGKRLPALEDKYKIEENRVRGCQSTVYLTADSKDGKVFYKAESDAVIVKGLISMLIRVLSRTNFHRTGIGRKKHIIQSMIKKIRIYLSNIKKKRRNISKLFLVDV